MTPPPKLDIVFIEDKLIEPPQYNRYARSHAYVTLASRQMSIIEKNNC